MPQVGDEPVRNVKRCGRDADQLWAQGDARLGQSIATNEQRRRGRVECVKRATQFGEPERGVADCASNKDDIVGLRATAPNDPADRRLAKGGDRDRDRPRRGAHVAANQVHAVFSLVLCKTGGEGANPRLVDPHRQNEVEQIGAGDRALGGQIREVDAQSLARHKVGRIVGQEIDAADDGVALYHKLVLRCRPNHCCVIEQAVGAGTLARERRKIPRDQFELARQARFHDHRLRVYLRDPKPPCIGCGPTRSPARGRDFRSNSTHGDCNAAGRTGPAPQRVDSVEAKRAPAPEVQALCHCKYHFLEDLFFGGVIDLGFFP